MDTKKGKNMPGEDGDYACPVRPPGGGYGATTQDITRGYRRIPNTDTDSRTGTYPPSPTLRDSDGI